MLYQVRYYFRQWPKKFECDQKILNTVKNIYFKQSQIIFEQADGIDINYGNTDCGVFKQRG